LNTNKVLPSNYNEKIVCIKWKWLMVKYISRKLSKVIKFSTMDIYDKRIFSITGLFTIPTSQNFLIERSRTILKSPVGWGCNLNSSNCNTRLISSIPLPFLLDDRSVSFLVDEIYISDRGRLNWCCTKLILNVLENSLPGTFSQSVIACLIFEYLS